MLISKPIPQKAALLIQAFQREKDDAQARLDLFVSAVMASLEIEGQVMKVDSAGCVLHVEVPDVAE